MRQGQQNRRGRGRSNNNNNNNGSSNNHHGRKPQNPLTRNYESNGPDVKIRGTAAQVAEKYMTLARDAASSGDSVMAENYLQHAEHYNRIIMAAQAQIAPQQPHHLGEPGHGMNGQHRPQSDNPYPVREQPQPVIEQPVATAVPPGMEPQPEIVDVPVAAAAAESAPDETAQPAAPRDAENGRRRRRRYPAGGASRANGSGENGSGHNGSGNGLDAAPDSRPSDEIVAN